MLIFDEKKDADYWAAQFEADGDAVMVLQQPEALGGKWEVICLEGCVA